jgi:hypothetical protein
MLEVAINRAVSLIPAPTWRELGDKLGGTLKYSFAGYLAHCSQKMRKFHIYTT